MQQGTKFAFMGIVAVSHLAVGSLGIAAPAYAQLIPDHSLGIESSVITPAVPFGNGFTDRIDGGAIRSGNLFHSFLEFNVQNGQQVHFANPTAIENIFSRVTGVNSSSILGTLGTLGPANLYLVNPNGILFGPNAQLDVRGSFVGTTANGVTFDNGYIFSALNPDVPPLLAINSPMGLSSWLPAMGNITNEGNLTVGQDLTLQGLSLNLHSQLEAGENLTLVATDNLTVRDSDSQPLIASAGKNLTLQGETIDLYILQHPGSGLISGNDITLISPNSIRADAHFTTGGEFQAQDLDGSPANVFSLEDPIVLAVGNVTLADYVGPSLHVLAGGNVQMGNVLITGPDTGTTTINPNNNTLIPGTTTPYSALSNVTLSDGTTTLEISGNTQATLDVRAGVDWTQAPFTREPGIGAPTVDPAGAVTINDPGGTPGSDITVGNIGIGQPGGLVLLTNQYQPNANLPAGTIEVISITGQFPPPAGAGSNIVIDARGDISLPAPAPISSVGAPGGSITLRSETAIRQPEDNALIQSVSLAGTGGDITLVAPIINLGGNASTVFVGAFGPGQGGDFNVEADSFQSDFSSIGAILVGPGNGGQAGNVNINSDSIFLDEVQLLSGVVQPGASGNSGDVTINTDSLVAINGTLIGSLTAGNGNAGNVNVVADSISLSGFRVLPPAIFEATGIFSTVEPGAVGMGGNIDITTNSLSLQNAAQIRTSSDAMGNAGSVVIRAEDITIDGAVFIPEILAIPNAIPTLPSAILSEMRPGSDGQGGPIDITTTTLAVTNGGTISASTQSGDAGSVTITATESASFDGLVSFAAVGEDARHSGASVETLEQATGDGGLLEITTPNLAVINGAQLEATTAGVGAAGDIKLNVSDTVLVDGVDSAIEANTTPDSTGIGGDVIIDPRLVLVQNGGRIAVDSQGAGESGNIVITSEQLRLDQGLISAEADSADGGNITLNLGPILLLRNGSNVSATAGRDQGFGNGGNVAITTVDGFVVAVDTENSDITANAFLGNGGNVTVNTQGLFGIEFRPALTPLSDITASSDFGLQGSVTIETPDIDPSDDLVQLPTGLVDASRLVAQGCGAGASDIATALGEFTVTGRGGLPPSPEQLNPQSDLAVWETLDDAPNTPTTVTQGSASSTVKHQSIEPRQIIEFQGWVVDDNGEIVLTAEATSVTPHNPWQSSFTCQTQG
ncbi:two-partner secretion domain-containing protein [Leptothoe spongobia]|uniref:Filamentous hemagglutinin N-terminal domain-containing protein n=1 Tax=Leptothoe spongobia TAU-MAC 1115 TaxID=1967444 RepID=A0A947DF82_9CYAN|nr:filamentous hemagglutinin N-terminal domain-containing protein [Leptothoe spongobia]MBT9315938.1 filamentous hemagglutinin N-terminal domain-containing protein [Leptothoe spongobia TAU-MAC 1115]